MVIEITTRNGETIKLTTDTLETVKIDNIPFSEPPKQEEMQSLVDEWLNGEAIK